MIILIILIILIIQLSCYYITLITPHHSWNTSSCNHKEVVYTAKYHKIPWNTTTFRVYTAIVNSHAITKKLLIHEIHNHLTNTSHLLTLWKQSKFISLCNHITFAKRLIKRCNRAFHEVKLSRTHTSRDTQPSYNCLHTASTRNVMEFRVYTVIIQ